MTTLRVVVAWELYNKLYHEWLNGNVHVDYMHVFAYEGLVWSVYQVRMLPWKTSSWDVIFSLDIWSFNLTGHFRSDSWGVSTPVGALEEGNGNRQGPVRKIASSEIHLLFISCSSQECLLVPFWPMVDYWIYLVDSRCVNMVPSYGSHYILVRAWIKHHRICSMWRRSGVRLPK